MSSIPAASTITYPAILNARDVGQFRVVWAVCRLSEFVLLTVTLTVTAQNGVGVTANHSPLSPRTA